MWQVFWLPLALVLLLSDALTAADTWTTDWQRDIGYGYAPPLVTATALFASGTVSKTDGSTVDRVFRLTTAGQVDWQRDLPASKAEGKVARFPDVRAQPALAGDAILVLSYDGRLRCLATDDGSLRWEGHLTTDWGGIAPGWGYSMSPLIKDGIAYLHIGGEQGLMVAFAVADGSLRWRSAVGGGATHTTAIHWRAVLVVVSDKEVIAVAPNNGAVQWRGEWETRGGNASPAPVPIGTDGLLLSSAYRRVGPSSRLFRINDGKVATVR